MEIIESYYLSETETMLFSDKDTSYFVAYNVIKEEFKGLGYVDYDTPHDAGHTITEIEILDYYVCNDELENIGKVSKRDLRSIENYLLSINNY